jgi:hypothetical protein
MGSDGYVESIVNTDIGDSNDLVIPTHAAIQNPFTLSGFRVKPGRTDIIIDQAFIALRNFNFPL